MKAINFVPVEYSPGSVILKTITLFKKIYLNEQKNGGSLLLKRVEIHFSCCRQGGFRANNNCYTNSFR